MKSSGNKARYFLNGAVFLILSSWMFLIIGFSFRPDAMAALTILPAWSWAVLGVLGSGVLLFRSRRVFALGLGLWLVFLGAFAEEPYGWLSLPPTSKSGLRVVSCNWGGGKMLPTKDLVALEPDLLLIQEAPSLVILQQLARDTKMSLLHSPEAAILAKGDLAELARGVYFLKARWNQTEVISLRLSPPLVRFDLWNPKCWSAYRDRRRERRGQLKFLLGLRGSPALIGGDFNVPAGDGALSPLREFRDCFDEVGSGQPNTAPSYLPLHRVDQLWCGDAFMPIQAFTAPVEGSDHRALVVDFQSRE